MEHVADRPEAAAIDSLMAAPTEKKSYLSLFTGTKEQTALLCNASSVY